MTFSIDNPEGGCNNPLWKYVWEKPSGEQGLKSILPFFLFTAVIYQFSTNWCYIYSSTLAAILINMPWYKLLCTMS